MYRELLYRNALKAIEDIYIQSKYNPDVDLYRSFDIINSVNENQFKSKEWLTDQLFPYIREHKDSIRNICILGSWYGLINFLLREKLARFAIQPHIHCVDTDPETIRIGKLLHNEIPNERTYFINQSAEEWIFDNIRKCDIIINTSVEHMEPDDVRLITAMKKPTAMVCFQGNNYHSVQSHINTHDSLDEFVESLNLLRVYYKGELQHDNYTRYMVIGI